jgi:hypothetical protein
MTRNLLNLLLVFLLLNISKADIYDSANTTVNTGSGDYISQSFLTSSFLYSTLHGEFSLAEPSAYSRYIDLDLCLDFSYDNSKWVQAMCSSSSGNVERIDYSLTSSNINLYYRWRIHVAQSTYSGYSLKILFKTNVQARASFPSTTFTIPAQLYQSDVWVYSGSGGDYVTDSFYISSSQYLYGQFSPVTPNSNIDVDLYLESSSSNSYWTNVQSSTSAGNAESINYYISSGQYYRWRIHVNRPSYSGESIHLTFKSNKQGYTTFTRPSPNNYGKMLSLPIIIGCSISIVLALIVFVFVNKRYPAVVTQAIAQENRRLIP